MNLLQSNEFIGETDLLLGKKIQELPSLTFPTKLDVINYVRFKMDSSIKNYQSKAEKAEKYYEIAQNLVLIWKKAYVNVSI